MVTLFALGAVCQSMASYAATFFVQGGGPWAGSVSKEWTARDEECFLLTSGSTAQQMIFASLFLA